MIYQIQLLFNLLGNQLGYKYPQIIHNLYSVTKKTKVIARKLLCLQTDNDRQTHKTIRDTVPQLVLPSSNNKTLNARLLARVITGCHYT